MADNYLYGWLFTEKDEQGDYFLLESLVEQKDESDKVKKEKAEQFKKSSEEWTELVKSRESFQGLRKPFRKLTGLSILLTMVSFSLFYYFTRVDTISQTEQLVLPIVLGSLAIISIIFSKYKWVSIFYYPIAIFVSLIWFSFTGAAFLSITFYGIAFLALAIIPSHYWREDIKQLKYAIKRAKILFRKGRYPIGSDLKKIERRLEYAIILDKGKRYGEQCGKEELSTQLTASYPLLNNPVYAIDSFSSSNLVLYTAVMSGGSSSSSSSPSSTGGGGAGAF